MGFLKEWIFSVFEGYRGLIVLFVCLPASFVFEFMLKVRFYLQRLEDKSDHDTKVAKIQSDIISWNKIPQEGRQLLCTARPNWLSLSTKFFLKKRCHKVDIPLYTILDLDLENLTVKVEPFVKVGDITKFLLPKGYLLAVHLEIAEATLGGLAMGTGMTTHSHKVGLYQESIISYDIILADGTLVHVTKFNKYSDLFKALPWSHGTLGFVVALELQIIPAKPFVRLKYIPVRGQTKYCNLIRELSGTSNTGNENEPDFLEATVFTKDEAVILAGWFSDLSSEIKVNSINKWYKPWFYKHVETFLQLGTSEELVPLENYLLRHNRSIFWVVESMIPFGNHVLFRFLFGWLLPPKVAFLKLTSTPGIRKMTLTKQVFQDLVLPLSTLEEQIDLSTRLFDLYPLLVYPCRIYDHGPNSGQIPRPSSENLCPGTNYALYNDLGIYGVPSYVKKKSKYNPVEALREMEAFTRRVGGFSFLYADIFMTRSEFGRMFDLTLYEEVRKKYKAEGAFPHLYDKVMPEINVFELGAK